MVFACDENTFSLSVYETAKTQLRNCFENFSYSAFPGIFA
jgi:hypothetical protein